MSEHKTKQPDSDNNASLEGVSIVSDAEPGRRFGIGFLKHRKSLIAIVLVLIVGFGSWWLWVDGGPFTKQPLQPISSSKVAEPTIDQKLAATKNTPGLSQQSKDDAIVAIAFRYYYDGQYAQALTTAKPYVNNPVYKQDILCNLYLNIYDKQHDTQNLQTTAKACASLVLANKTTNSDTQKVNLYKLGFYYAEAGDTANSHKYYGQFVAYIESNNLQNDSDLSGMYQTAKKGLQ